MATLNVNGAVSAMTSTSFMMSVGLIAVGSLVGQMWTDWARNNVVDVGVQGGDAAYSLLGGVLVLAVLPRKWGRPMAMGMGASGLLTAARDFNIV